MKMDDSGPAGFIHQQSSQVVASGFGMGRKLVHEALVASLNSFNLLLGHRTPQSNVVQSDLRFLQNVPFFYHGVRF